MRADDAYEDDITGCVDLAVFETRMERRPDIINSMPHVGVPATEADRWADLPQHDRAANRYQFRHPSESVFMYLLRAGRLARSTCGLPARPSARLVRTRKSVRRRRRPHCHATSCSIATLVLAY